MNLMWWAEHSSQLALLLLTAVATHLLMSFSQTVMPDLDTGREKSALVQCRTAQCGALSTTRVGWLGLVYAAGCGLGGGSSWTLGGRATPTA